MPIPQTSNQGEEWNQEESIAAARKQFSREFKLEAVKLLAERGVSVRQAAQDLDVHENVLRKEVAKLRMERDLLNSARPTS